MPDRQKYKRVTPTPEERAEHKKRWGRTPATYRYECNDLAGLT